MAPELWSVGLAALSIAFGISVAAQEPDRALLVDVSARTGVSFVHRAGSPEKDWIAEVNGSGVALFDHDGDGDLDVYLVNGSTWDATDAANAPRNELWRNDGGWRFTDVTAACGVGDTGWGSGALVADVDNDGDLDLYVTNRGPNVLYLNRGDGVFEPASRSGSEDPRWSTSASFADLDRDGLVDLYVANYVAFSRDRVKPRSSGACTYKGAAIFCGPGGLDAEPDSLFVNQGGGRFRDASDEWGVRRPKPSYGLGTLAVDVDRDGFLDVVVANDTRSNFCFLNQKGRGFVEAGVFLGLAYNDYGVGQAGMGLASGDVDGDGLDDLLVTNFEDDTNTLHIAEPDGFWVERTFAAGLGSASYPFLGWGALFLDADGDGDLDLFVANGHVAPEADSLRASLGYRQRDQLFLNDGRGKFHDARDAIRAPSWSSRGAACGDLDGDGDPDVVVNNIDAPATFLENRARARWVTVSPIGTRSNRVAIGARVVLAAGGKTQARTIESGASWASQSELVARFGIAGDAIVDDLRVRWPTGITERFARPVAGDVVRVIEGSGVVVSGD